jgi:fructose-1,6-bisphosphatase/inositol monophosphatase family enzyme
MAYEKELDCAVKAAKSGKELLLENFGKKIELKNKSNQEIVTKIDVDCENRIKKILLEEYPTYGMLSEETENKKVNSGNYWIVDPIDGTTNFFHGIPGFPLA